jgi:hypothetical protein
MKSLRYIVSLIALALFAVVVDFALRPASVKAATADPISVLCTACVINPSSILPVYLIVRDETTGQVWAYPRSNTTSNVHAGETDQVIRNHREHGRSPPPGRSMRPEPGFQAECEAARQTGFLGRGIRQIGAASPLKSHAFTSSIRFWRPFFTVRLPMVRLAASKSAIGRSNRPRSARPQQQVASG